MQMVTKFISTYDDIMILKCFMHYGPFYKENPLLVTAEFPSQNANKVMFWFLICYYPKQTVK